jgi:ribosomal-protein-alanine N-acetyltransferase
VTAARAQVRPGSLADLWPVERIERASFSDPWTAETLAQELLPSLLRLPLVAEVAGEVAGYLLAWRTPDQLHILNVAVDPARRRDGIGALLLQRAIDEARRGGMHEVTLEVRRTNLAARAMYRAFGFAETGVRAGYYADTGEDALVLTLVLDP